MIVKEEQKKEGNDEKLFINLIECYLLLDNRFSLDLYPICVPCLIKVSLKKEEDEETQKEVEIALLALSRIDDRNKIERDLYLNEVKEIIQYHQKHRNLTRLAYQSAWGFLIKRFLLDKSLEVVIANELHFEREVESELDGLMQSVDWKKKEEEMGETERKAMDIISRWISSIRYNFFSCNLWNEEYAELISRIVDLFRASRDNHNEMGKECIQSIKAVAKYRTVKLDDLLKSGVIDAGLEEIQRPTPNERMTYESLKFYYMLSLRFKGMTGDEMEEAKRKELKRKMLEKMEEKGVEDIFNSFQETFRFFFPDDSGFIHL
ncbi:uncharacterized protein MONOS_11250 [Monocercomonoides exilis]|uniref:uncharacterized protein n=1 Tax=Monocercomonoides exilis TaxID=2049356 RepID=UPI00355A5281|nr:hypothetical protein MONOS_11250 [Monocercomonoides exilis]|eukprot:MONOS_11250.1-p1 / transcript=MONOS_11250.1 / gene=MONOS_11250 / organism=Monocercomonoides_exilis_PA203 / gene_product=unspecified product / transcript_product=unspecified product / location=Mono_scaffold00554:15321-16339(-) / protein_length=320 / sequence_SO=supercontig / SO=protein_coding / is_pseudo=false